MIILIISWYVKLSVSSQPKKGNWAIFVTCHQFIAAVWPCVDYFMFNTQREHCVQMGAGFGAHTYKHMCTHTPTHTHPHTHTLTRENNSASFHNNTQRPVCQLSLSRYLPHSVHPIIILPPSCPLHLLLIFIPCFPLRVHRDTECFSDVSSCVRFIWIAAASLISFSSSDLNYWLLRSSFICKYRKIKKYIS